MRMCRGEPSGWRFGDSAFGGSLGGSLTVVRVLVMRSLTPSVRRAPVPEVARTFAGARALAVWRVGVDVDRWGGWCVPWLGPGAGHATPGRPPRGPGGLHD